MRNRKLMLAWQDPVNRGWHPIGCLTFDGTNYRFAYTKGVFDAQRESNFQPLVSFPDFNEIYESSELFPLFLNRVLSQSRPEYGNFVEWLNIHENKDDPVALLARSGGRRATDTLEVFPFPEPDENGQFHIHFFAHGLRHLSSESQERVCRLITDEQLLLALDFQNPYDPSALLLRTHDTFPGDRFIVGYCPRYLRDDTLRLVDGCSGCATVTVERVNLSPAPLEFRLLCNLTTCWPPDFQPFSGLCYQPIREDILVV